MEQSPGRQMLVAYICGIESAFGSVSTYGGGWTGCIASRLHSCYLTRGLWPPAVLDFVNINYITVNLVN